MANTIQLAVGDGTFKLHVPEMKSLDNLVSVEANLDNEGEINLIDRPVISIRPVSYENENLTCEYHIHYQQNNNQNQSVNLRLSVFYRDMVLDTIASKNYAVRDEENTFTNTNTFNEVVTLNFTPQNDLDAINIKYLKENAVQHQDLEDLHDDIYNNFVRKDTPNQLGEATTLDWGEEGINDGHTYIDNYRVRTRLINLEKEGDGSSNTRIIRQAGELGIDFYGDGNASYTINGSGTPSKASDLVNKAYVDNLSSQTIDTTNFVRKDEVLQTLCEECGWVGDLQQQITKNGRDIDELQATQSNTFITTREIAIDKSKISQTLMGSFYVYNMSYDISQWDNNEWNLEAVTLKNIHKDNINGRSGEVHDVVKKAITSIVFDENTLYINMLTPTMFDYSTGVIKAELSCSYSRVLKKEKEA